MANGRQHSHRYINSVASLNCPVKRIKLAQNVGVPGATMAQPLQNGIAIPTYLFATPPHPSPNKTSGRSILGPYYPIHTTSASSSIYGYSHHVTLPTHDYSYPSTAKSPGRISSSPSFSPNSPPPSVGSSSVPNQASPGTFVAAAMPATNAMTGMDDNAWPA
jgi:hypothetical protein